MPMGLLNMHAMSKCGFSLYNSVESAITCSDNVAICADEASILGFVFHIIGLLLRQKMLQYDHL